MEPQIFQGQMTADPLEGSPSLEETVYKNRDTSFYGKELGGLNKFGNIT